MANKADRPDPDIYFYQDMTRADAIRHLTNAAIFRAMQVESQPSPLPVTYLAALILRLLSPDYADATRQVHALIELGITIQQNHDNKVNK